MKISQEIEFPVLAQLPATERNRFIQTCPRKQLTRGTALFHEGDPPRAAYLVASGLLKAVKYTPRSIVSAMDLIFPGRLCGVIALLDKRPYPLTVVALQNSEVLAMSASSFDSLMRAHSAFAQSVHQEMGDHLRHAQTMRAMATEPVERRVAHLLSLLLPETGAEVRLRREDIAELVGCIPETAIRVLADFNRRGILRTGWKRITLMDRSSLEKFTVSHRLTKSTRR
ncbi:MAG: Crp/Fnr family transcriptional regulator [Elusimicrobia bacterium]|nr:Crp/Fnr family transcriptional regulator [Elusimicrobiota bacterium]